MNRGFHEHYDRLRDAERSSFGAARPALVVGGAKLAWRQGGRATEYAVQGERYHALKAIAHVPVGLVSLLAAGAPGALDGRERAALAETKGLLAAAEASLGAAPLDAASAAGARRLFAASGALVDEALAEGRRPTEARLRAFGRAVREDLEANLAAAAGAQLEALDDAVRAIRRAAGERAWADAVVVVRTSHQARAREIAVQYFERLLVERAAEGAAGEGRLVVLEAPSGRGRPEDLAADHFVDRRLSDLLFDDPAFLQRDAVGRYAGPHLDRLLR